MRKYKKVSDSNRFSILQPDMDRCYICSGPPDDIHECIPGNGKRDLCKSLGLCVSLCRKHHDEAHRNKEMAAMLKAHAQLAFERTHSREEWMELFRRNYL